MSHRTQITLEDQQYDLLCAESRRTGLGLAELVRRALDHTYGASGSDERLKRLDVSFGSWADIEVDGAAYVEHRRHGLGQRIERQRHRA